VVYILIMSHLSRICYKVKSAFYDLYVTTLLVKRQNAFYDLYVTTLLVKRQNAYVVCRDKGP